MMYFLKLLQFLTRADQSIMPIGQIGIASGALCFPQELLGAHLGKFRDLILREEGAA